MRPPPVHHRWQRGFSMVELVLVMMIMGILTSLAVPKVFSLITDVEERTVTERLVEDLTYLRNYAITYHDTTWLVVDVGSNQYGLYVGPDALSRTLIPDPMTGSSAVVDLGTEYDNTSITSASFGGSAEVSFNWWGVPSSSGSVVINGDQTIQVVAGTGLAYEAP